MFTPQNKSCLKCHVSHVTCHMSRVTCHMSQFFGEAYRWKVCYQRGLPRLVIHVIKDPDDNLVSIFPKLLGFDGFLLLDIRADCYLLGAAGPKEPVRWKAPVQAGRSYNISSPLYSPHQYLHVHISDTRQCLCQDGCWALLQAWAWWQAC